MADKILKKLNIKVWRQNRASEKGKFETYTIENISTGSSFLEMMDILNNELLEIDTEASVTFLGFEEQQEERKRDRVKELLEKRKQREQSQNNS